MNVADIVIQIGIGLGLVIIANGMAWAWLHIRNEQRKREAEFLELCRKYPDLHINGDYSRPYDNGRH